MWVAISCLPYIHIGIRDISINSVNTCKYMWQGWSGEWNFSITWCAMCRRDTHYYLRISTAHASLTSCCSAYTSMFTCVCSLGTEVTTWESTNCTFLKNAVNLSHVPLSCLMHPRTYLRVKLVIILFLSEREIDGREQKTNSTLCDVMIRTSSWLWKISLFVSRY